MRDFIKTSIIAIVALLVGVQTMNAETRRALLVGISDYGNAMEDPNKWANISGANDVLLLSPLFSEQGYTVTSLVDSMATHANITKALEQLAKDSKKGDKVYIHFSMHGQPFEDLNGDEKDGWDEALIPVDAEMLYAKGVYEGKNHLLDDELEVYFNDIRRKIGANGKLCIALDVDHGSEFTSSGKKILSTKAKESKRYFNLSTDDSLSSITLIAACRPFQGSREMRDMNTSTWYGSLSYYIAQSMRDNQTVGSDKWIDAIKNGMANNHRLRKQNMVIEKIK